MIRRQLKPSINLNIVCNIITGYIIIGIVYVLISLILIAICNDHEENCIYLYNFLYFGIIIVLSFLLSILFLLNIEFTTENYVNNEWVLIKYLKCTYCCLYTTSQYYENAQVVELIDLEANIETKS